MTQDIRISSIELLVTCPHCGDPVPVNSLETQVVCDNCQNEFNVTPKTWARIFNGLDEDWGELSHRPEGTNKRTWSMGLGSGPRLVYGPDNPRCMKCQTLLPINEYPFGSQGEIPCPSCGTRHVTYPAPEWLRQQAPTVEQFYCGAPPQTDSTGASLNIEQSSIQPVVMQCPQCGGSLKVTAQSDRTLPCSFCGVDIYLPDGLWKKLHPVKTKKRWYVCYQGVPLAVLERQREDERRRRTEQEEQQRRIEAAANWSPANKTGGMGMSKILEWALFIGMGLGIPGMIFGIRSCNKKRIQKKLSAANKQIATKMPDISPKISGQFEVNHPKLGNWTLQPTKCWSGERAGYFGVQLGSKSTPYWVYVSKNTAAGGSLLVEIQKKGSDKALQIKKCRVLKGSVVRTNTRVNHIWAMKGHLDIACDLKNKKGKKEGHIKGNLKFNMCH